MIWMKHIDNPNAPTTGRASAAIGTSPAPAARTTQARAGPGGPPGLWRGGAPPPHQTSAPPAAPRAPARASPTTRARARGGCGGVGGWGGAPARHNTSAHAAAARTSDLDPEIARIGALSAAKVMELLGTGPHGLTEQQARRVRSVHGANIIAPETHDPLTARLSRAFLTPFTLILLALAAI